MKVSRGDAAGLITAGAGLSALRSLAGALAGVTATVVGVMLNPALVFGAAVICPCGLAGGAD